MRRMVGNVIIDKLLELNNKKMGFDVMTGKVVNMYEKGIIDPTKVSLRVS